VLCCAEAVLCFCDCFAIFVPRPDGSTVAGESQYGQYHGQVAYTWADGAIYVGEMRNVRGDQQSWAFTLTQQPTASACMCLALDCGLPLNLQGKRNGNGRYTYPKGGHYEGEWENGKYNGYGTHVDAKGRIYVGSWKDGNKHG